MTTPRDPTLIVVSDQLYRMLLCAYPRRFRHSYQDEVAQLFRDCCRDAQRSRGTYGLLRVWGRGLLDLCVNVPREHVAQLVARHKPAQPARSCSVCYSEIQSEWRVCPICGMQLSQATTHDTRPIAPRKVDMFTAGYLGANRSISFKDEPRFRR